MKCPECGFVSFPGLDRCKKCGHLLTPARSDAKEAASLFSRPYSAIKAPEASGAEHIQDRMEMGGQEAGELDIELNPQGASALSIEPNEEHLSSPRPDSEAGQDWQAELAQRVEDFRRRRAHLRKAKEGDRETLDLDFGPSARGTHESHPNLIEFPSSEELGPQGKTAPGSRPGPRVTGLENFEPSFQPEGSGIPPASGRKTPSHDDMAPLEIELGSSQENTMGDIRAGATSEMPGASMSARMFAGAIDAVVLLSGAALYTLIFWRTGGRLSTQPLELGVAGLITVFFVVFYFAGCTVLSCATPGLIWAGLEVTTFEGNPPGVSDCLWRAFGYLVSMSALMLGFVWAVVDVDGLTWHDRMSRTFVVPADNR